MPATPADSPDMNEPKPAGSDFSVADPHSAEAVAPTRVFGRLFPVWARAFVRTREAGVVVVALVIGAVSGLFVTGMSLASQYMHEWLFGLPHGLRLSLAPTLTPWRAVAVVAAGGIILALLAKFVAPRFRGRVHDAIEANALLGGRMSIGGSLFITAQTMVSNGFGGSVGLEAAYTQVCSAFSSRLGRELGARRNDMRLLVACGAAGAIAAAFNAPLAGAFYAFETVLGSYTVASLAPIAASAVVSTLVSRLFVDHSLLTSPPGGDSLAPTAFAHIVLVALLCSGVAIALMSMVANTERVFNSLVKPGWLRPVVGGLVVGAIGMATPAALGSGHGAILLATSPEFSAMALLAMLVLKFAASSVSLGSGFRGGLFFASLMIGAYVGRCYADVTALVAFTARAEPAAMAVVGMTALGTGIVGAPMSMTFLALEMTGDFGVTLSAFIASLIVTVVVRGTFGYSFATWRFHLRGETIRGPHDVGWMRDLSVARLMRKDVRTLPEDTTVGQARIRVPLGVTKEVMLTDADGRYCGSVLVGDIHAAETDPIEPIAKLAHQQKAYLTPRATVKDALDMFAAEEADVLAVVTDDTNRRVIGRLSEAHALRRYGEELEKRNRAFVER
ncbi:MAG: chloride channel protein [Rhodoblastus sp.]|nr:chloride channel protein [Rhodoblastus sp.]